MSFDSDTVTNVTCDPGGEAELDRFMRTILRRPPPIVCGKVEGNWQLFHSLKPMPKKVRELGRGAADPAARQAADAARWSWAAENWRLSCYTSVSDIERLGPRSARLMISPRSGDGREFIPGLSKKFPTLTFNCATRNLDGVSQFRRGRLVFEKECDSPFEMASYSLQRGQVCTYGLYEAMEDPAARTTANLLACAQIYMHKTYGDDCDEEDALEGRELAERIASVLGEAIEKDGANAEAWHLRGRHRLKSGDGNGGRADLERALSLGADAVEVELDLVEFDGDGEERLGEVLERESRSIRAMNSLLASMVKRDAEGETEFAELMDRILAIDPRNAKALNHRRSFQRSGGDRKGALESALRMVAVSSDWEGRHVHKVAESLIELRRAAEAREMLLDQIESDLGRHSAKNYSVLSRALAALKQSDEMDAILANVLDSARKGDEKYHLQICAAAGRPAFMIRAYEEAKAAGHADSTGLDEMHYVKALVETGRIDDAIAFVVERTVEECDLPFALFQLYRIAPEYGHADECIALMEDLASQSELKTHEFVVGWLVRALCRYPVKRLLNPRRALELLAKYDSENDRHRAMAHAAAADFSLAVEHQRLAITKADPSARTALEEELVLYEAGKPLPSDLKPPRRPKRKAK